MLRIRKALILTPAMILLASIVVACGGGLEEGDQPTAIFTEKDTLTVTSTPPPKGLGRGSDLVGIAIDIHGSRQRRCIRRRGKQSGESL